MKMFLGAYDNTIEIQTATCRLLFLFSLSLLSSKREAADLREQESKEKQKEEKKRLEAEKKEQKEREKKENEARKKFKVGVLIIRA